MDINTRSYVSPHQWEYAKAKYTGSNLDLRDGDESEGRPALGSQETKSQTPRGFCVLDITSGALLKYIDPWGKTVSLTILSTEVGVDKWYAIDTIHADSTIDKIRIIW